MARVVQGVVKDNVVVLPGGINLPDGTKVEVYIAADVDEAAPPDESVQRVEQALLAAGLLSEIKHPPRSLPTDEYVPIEVRGSHSPRRFSTSAARWPLSTWIRAPS